MTKPINEIDDPRLVKALAHPIRVRIIAILEEAPASPKQMSDALGLPIENVAYHVRTLAKLGLARLHHTSTTRGAVEHFYTTDGRPTISSEAWDALPEIYREAIDSASLRQIFDVVRAAGAQGHLQNAESQLRRFRFGFDRQGFQQASEALTSLIDRLIEIESESQQRMQGRDDEYPAVYVGMLFGAPNLNEPLTSTASILRTPVDQLPDRGDDTPAP